MKSRHTWLNRVSVTAVSATAFLALAAPAEALPASAAPVSAASAQLSQAPAAAAPAAASSTAAAVDYETWQRDCQAVMDKALPYLKERIAQGKPGEKQAIVLDIDNTALETDFGFSFPQPANKPVLKVAQYAEERKSTR